MYTWVNGLGEKRKRSTLERLRKESVRDHKNIRLSGEGGVGEAEGSVGQNYGLQAQAAVQGYVQNLTGGGGGASNLFPSGGGGHGGGGHGGGHGSSHSHSSVYAPGYGSGGGGGFPNIPGVPSQLPNLFGGSGHGRREGPGDAVPQPSPYSSSYAPAEPSYGDTSYRSIPPEPRTDQPSVYASPYASSYAPSHPEPSGGGYQPSYGPPPQQFGFGGGYSDVGSGFSGGFGREGPREPQPQPQTQADEMNSDPWQDGRQFGYPGYPKPGDSGAPGFPNPQQGYGF